MSSWPTPAAMMASIGGILSKIAGGISVNSASASHFSPASGESRFDVGTRSFISDSTRTIRAWEPASLSASLVSITSSSASSTMLSNRALRQRNPSGRTWKVPNR